MGDRALRLLHVVDDVRIDEAAGIKIDITIALEPHQGADTVVIVVGHDCDIAGAGRGKRPIRHRLQFEREAETGAREEMPLPVENDRLGQRTQRRLCAHHFVKALRVEAEKIGVAVKIVRHADDIGTDGLLMLVEIGLGDRERAGNGGVDALAEPGLHAEAEQQIGEDRDDHRRDHRDKAEQDDESRMKTRAGEATAALGPELYQPPRDDGDQRQQQDEIE